MAFVGRSAVEIFHLQFLRQLASGTDRTHFTLKGGCNLRFFFGSIRYSEDLDLDVTVVAQETLKRKVDRLLQSPALGLPLRAHQMIITDVSAPKQTETTQRWKLGLSVAGYATPLRTKVEFSRRAQPVSAADTVVESADRELARSYAMLAPVARHYRAAAALVQKVQALVGRPEAQARDVFDLQLLHTRLATLPELEPLLKSKLAFAADRVMSLTYDDYQGQVFAYLAPEHTAPFAGRRAWEEMQAEVLQLLEALSA